MKFNYCIPWKDISNGLSVDQNIDHMKKLCPRKVDVPTYLFGVKKTIDVSSSRIMFRVHYIQIMVQTLLTIVFLGESFLTFSQATQLEIMCKSYTHDKLTYQLTALGFIKLLVFNFQGSYLMYTIQMGWCSTFNLSSSLMILFLTISRATLRNILYKSYTLEMLTYQLTTSEFTNMFLLILQSHAQGPISLFSFSTRPFNLSLE